MADPLPPGRLTIRLHAWRRRPRRRAALYLGLIVLSALVLSARYRFYLSTPRAVMPAPTGAAAHAWFRPRPDSLTPIEVRDAVAGDLNIAYRYLSTTRGHPSGQVESLMVAVKVLAVGPQDAAARARSEGLDIPLALARAMWFDPKLEPDVIRPADDPNAVTLRSRNSALLRGNARRYTGAWFPAAVLGAALAIGLGEALAVLGGRLFPRGHCLGCGYPLADLPQKVCPECGRAPE
ncbi:MAG TPA: hypothetical protein VFF69_16535 [Phycisphaerales bacterium]|nr:hypothetical protein [Phycisphaerales bacterium]